MFKAAVAVHLNVDIVFPVVKDSFLPFFITLPKDWKTSSKSL